MMPLPLDDSNDSVVVAGLKENSMSGTSLLRNVDNTKKFILLRNGVEGWIR
jgi:hypothetical protein